MLLPYLIPQVRPKAKNENIITYGQVRITVLKPCLFRIEKSKEKKFIDNATQAVWYRDHDKVCYEHRVEDNVIIVETSKAKLMVNTDDISKSMVSILGGDFVYINNGGNLKGTYRTLDTSDGKHLLTDKTVTQYDREHIPLSNGVCSKNGVAVYDDSESLILLNDGLLEGRPNVEQDLYIFAFGKDFYGAVKALYQICGYPPVVPRWALGNWWSRYWPYTQQEYINLMDNFQDDGIPISVAVIDMDWHYVDIDTEFSIKQQELDGEVYGGTNGWTGYTWNTRLFPDHVDFLNELHRRKMKVTLNLHPADGVRWYEKEYKQIAKEMGIDTDLKLRIPFRIDLPEFVVPYLEIMHHTLEEEGVDFWWIDWQQGTSTHQKGLDPLWALNHYHYIDNQARKGQGLILSRYAGVGSHRYPIGFSGDTLMTWQFLDYLPYFTATATNVGYTWWSHDIGGHYQGERDEELYLRWLQFGVFSPINRIHCCPAATTSKEPWKLSSGSRAIAEKWFQLRHQLIPYIYTYSCKTAYEGIPLISPMYYKWPDEEQAYTMYNQYMFGDNLIVAPITSKSKKEGIGEVEVWLPKGKWTDIFTNVCYTGGQIITMYRDTGSIPVLAKEGACIPLDAHISNGCSIPKEINLWVYNGSGRFEMYEDTEKQGVYSNSIFEVRQEENKKYVLEIDTNKQLDISDRKIHVFFKNISKGEVNLIVDEIPQKAEIKYNRCLQVIFSVRPGQIAKVIVQDNSPTHSMKLKNELLDIMIQASGDNRAKDKEWEKIPDTETEIIKWINELEFISETRKKMMVEMVNGQNNITN